MATQHQPLPQDIDPAAAVSAVLALHHPIRRYKASFRDETTYPTAQRAFEVNQADPMCGYESIPLCRPEEAESVDLCAECSRVENGLLDEDDAVHGSDLSTDACTWPCSTVVAIGEASR